MASQERVEAVTKETEFWRCPKPVAYTPRTCELLKGECVKRTQKRAAVTAALCNSVLLPHVLWLSKGYFPFQIRSPGFRKV
jgi:hypothetical protein